MKFVILALLLGLSACSKKEVFFIVNCDGKEVITSYARFEKEGVKATLISGEKFHFKSQNCQITEKEARLVLTEAGVTVEEKLLGKKAKSETKRDDESVVVMKSFELPSLSSGF